MVDFGNFRVQHFDKARKWLANIGTFGNEDGAFLDPIGIAVGPDGLIYVADDARNDVQVFTRHLGILRPWPPSTSTGSGSGTGCSPAPASWATARPRTG